MRNVFRSKSIFRSRKSKGVRPSYRSHSSIDLLSQRADLLIKGLPILTFAGLLLGLCYAKGYLEVFEVEIFDVAGTADFIRAAIFGLGVTACAVISAFIGYVIGVQLPKTKAVQVLAIVSVLMAVLTALLLSDAFYVAMFEYVVNDEVNENISAIFDAYQKASINIGYYIANWKIQSVSIMLTIFFVGVLCGVVPPLPRRLNFLVSLGGVVFTILISATASTAGAGAATARYLDHFAGNPEEAIFSKTRISPNEGMPLSCQCGAFPLWSGDRASVFICDGLPNTVYGPENIVLKRSPGGSSVLDIWKSKRTKLGFDNLVRSAAATCSSEGLARRMADAHPRAIYGRDNFALGVKSVDGSSQIGMVCEKGRLFIKVNPAIYLRSTMIYMEFEEITTINSRGEKQRVLPIYTPARYPILDSYLLIFDREDSSSAPSSLFVQGQEYDVKKYARQLIGEGCLSNRKELR